MTFQHVITMSTIVNHFSNVPNFLPFSSHCVLTRTIFFFTRQYVFRLETRTYVLEIIIKNMNRKYLLGTSDEEGRERKKERKKEGKLE